jgi:hypothetical protein
MQEQHHLFLQQDPCRDRCRSYGQLLQQQKRLHMVENMLPGSCSRFNQAPLAVLEYLSNKHNAHQLPLLAC